MKGTWDTEQDLNLNDMFCGNAIANVVARAPMELKLVFTE